jgi:hypothetical protein
MTPVPQRGDFLHVLVGELMHNCKPCKISTISLRTLRS